MDCLNITLPTPEENLALDEALLEEAESPAAAGGGEVLRFWESPQYFVVLGAGGRLAEEVDAGQCAARAIPILRRCSGGGAVVQGPGCLNFALVLDARARPELRTIESGNTFVLQTMARALDPLCPGARRAGISDLATGDRKFGGSAQKRKRGHVLLHGTILHHFNLELISACLPEPPRPPAYREGRSHTQFLVNTSADPARLRAAIAAAWGASSTGRPWPRQKLEELVQAKYARPDWNYWR
jgi:lipoate-protein ligase A